jgi:hypothetical protein
MKFFSNMTEAGYRKMLNVLAIGGVCLVVAPIIWYVVSGLIGLVTAAVVCAVFLAFRPAVTERLTQLKFQALNAVISRAPVESLYQRAKERVEELNNQREVLNEQAANLEGFKKKAANFAKRFPEDAGQMAEKLAGYEKLFAYRIDLFKHAKKETQKFIGEVEKAEAIYEMAVADAALGKSFNKGNDFMSLYREKTAFDAIDKANNTAMANLRMALIDDAVVTSQIADTEVHAVAYDADDRVVLGNIMDMGSVKIPVAAEYK